MASHAFLQCDSCHEKLAFPDEDYLYTDAESPQALEAKDPKLGGFDVPCRKIWCHACNAPSHREHVPDEQAFTLALAIAKSTDGLLLPEGAERDVEIERVCLNYKGGGGLDVDLLRLYGSRLINRHADTPCLRCGSRALTDIDDRRRLLHEDCGGALISLMWIGSYVSRWAPWSQTMRYFGWDGTFKWALRFWSDDPTTREVHWEPVAIDRWPRVDDLTPPASSATPASLPSSPPAT